MKTTNHKPQITKKGRSAGFTVLESLVAILILSLSVSGVFSVVQQSLSQNIIAKDEIRAFYLAQEAIEIVRNRRDTNQLVLINLGTGHWLADIAQHSSDPCYVGRICRAQASDMSLTSCGSSWGSCENLRQNPTTLLYGYSSGNLTNFNREIQIEPIPSRPNEASVTVSVTWKKGIFEREFKVKTHLFNWVRPI